LHDLVRARQAEVDHLVGRTAGNVFSRKGDGSLVRLVDPIHDIEECCLPGTVRTDQAQDLTLSDAETDVRNRYQPAETFADAAHFQDGIHSITLRARGTRRYTQPIKPPGANSTTMSSSPPAITRWKLERTGEVRR